MLKNSMNATSLVRYNLARYGNRNVVLSWLLRAVSPELHLKFWFSQPRMLNPSMVTHTFTREQARKNPTTYQRMSHHFVVDGSWDLDSVAWKMDLCIHQLFVESRPPEETDQYLRMLKNVREGSPLWNWNCTTEAEVESYFVRLKNANNSIAAGDYRTARQLGNDPGDEIQVGIGRRGNFIHLGRGKHRLSLARLHNCNSVPVILKCVHPLFVSRIVEQETNGSIQANRNFIDSWLERSRHLE